MELDFYLSEENCYNRLRNEYKKYGKIIIAVDYDDTLYNYHKVEGRSYDMVINLLKRWRKHAYFILYTASNEERYESMWEYIYRNDIPIDIINENVENTNIPKGGKLYYNVMICDRSGIGQVYKMLLRLIEEIETGNINNK